MQKNKLTTYLLYAIGEIVLVVIGILIAVSINNWNQLAKEAKAEQALLKKVMNDLEVDAKGFVENKKTGTRINSFHQDCFSIILNKKEPADVVFSETNLVRRAMYISPITQGNYPDLVNRVNNEDVKEAISIYFRWLHNMDVANKEFEDVVFQIRRTISMKGAHNLSALYDQSNLTFNSFETTELVTQEGLLKLLEDEYFQQLLLECNLKLIETQGELDSLIVKNSELKSRIADNLAN